MRLVVAVVVLSARVALAFVDSPVPCANPAWQPGGELLACTVDSAHEHLSRSGLVIMGADGRERVFVLGASGAFAWRPDGKQLAAADRQVGESRLLFFNPAGQEGVLWTNAALVLGMAWAPERELWYARPAIMAEGRTDIDVAKADGTGSNFCANCASPAFAADGRLAYLRPPRTIVIVDRRSNQYSESAVELPKSSDPLAQAMPLLSGPSWSPDGRYVAFVAMADRNSGTLALIDTRVATLNLRALGGSVGDLAWAPDSKEIATSVEGSSPGQSKVVAVRATDGKRRDLAPPDAGCSTQMPAWSTAGLAVVHNCRGVARLRIYSR